MPCAFSVALALSFLPDGRAQTPSEPAPAIGAALAQLRKAPRDPLLLARLRAALAAAPARDDQTALGLAVFALGSLWLERVADAEAARQALLRRFPDTAEARTLEDWDGLFRPCGWCHGTGIRGGEICARCNGTGKCPVCGGAGRVALMGRRQAPCSACNGSGKCSACGGKGREEGPCPRCGGTGRVPLPERAFRLYRAVLKAEVE